MSIPQDVLFQNIKIRHIDMGGWLRFAPDEGSRDVPDLPAYLSTALTEFLRTKPHLRIRFVVPVLKDGNTVELHAWYEQHLFSNLSGYQAEESAT